MSNLRIDRKNHNRLLVSLTDTMLVWIEENCEADDVQMPWIGNNTAMHMAEAALATLEAADDLRASLIEAGELKETT